MARGINKVFLIGNLGQDPESRMAGESAVVNFTVATTDSWKDKQTGEKQEKTEWHRVIAFRNLAEICQQYLRKGSKVYIEGRLQTRKWQDNSGSDRYTTEIIANGMQMLDRRESAPENRSEGISAHTNKPATNPQKPPPPQNQPQGDFDDDLPF